MTKIKYNRHLFQILEPSLWPFFLASGLFFLVTGLAFTMHYIIKGYYIILLGINYTINSSINNNLLNVITKHKSLIWKNKINDE